MIDFILSNFDLNDKEILIIKKVLELGTQPASIIARSLDMPRNTVRTILDKLEKDGFIQKNSVEKTNYYSIEEKEILIRQLKIKQRKEFNKLQRQISIIQEHGDKLNSVHKSKSKPKVTFYEGTNGLEKAYEDTLTSSETINSWASFEGMHEGLPDYFETYYQRRAGNNIAIKSIHPSSKLAQDRIKNDSQEKRTSLIVDSKKFNWIPEIQVYDNKVNIASWKENIAVIIESEEIAEAMKNIFKLSWIGAKNQE